MSISKALLLLFLAMTSVGASATVNKCEKQFILSVNDTRAGAIKSTRKFTAEEIYAIPATDMITATAWHPSSKFSGPTLEEIIKAASPDLDFKTARLFAVNGYETPIPAQDIKKYRPILAHSKDNARLTLATRGPLFLVYPRDEFSELKSLKSQDKFVWMVCRIDLQ